MSKFTPGPWKTERQWGTDDETHQKYFYWMVLQDKHLPSDVIVSFPHERPDRDGLGSPEIAATARLIAAAPELLDALKHAGAALDYAVAIIKAHGDGSRAVEVRNMVNGHTGTIDIAALVAQIEQGEHEFLGPISSVPRGYKAAMGNQTDVED